MTTIFENQEYPGESLTKMVNFHMGTARFTAQRAA